MLMLSRSFVYIICLSIPLINTETIPRFDMRDKDGIIFDPIAPRAGERLIATCTLVGLTPNDKHHVEWSLKRFNDGKNFTLAVDTDVLQFNQPVPRLHAIHATESSDWVLIFDPLDRDDIGNLTCRLTDTNSREIYLTRFLNVISEPLVLESSTKDIEVNEGDSVTLVCNAQGYPAPTIEWQKADAQPLSSGHIRQMGSQLHLHQVTRRESGIYKCLASNLVGFGSEWTLKLSVRFRPYVYCERDVGQATDFLVDAYMECYVYGYPPPKISWRHERSAGLSNIWNSQDYLIEATIPEMSICTDCILSRLTIIHVKQAHLGNYYINATAPDFPSEFGRVTLYQTSDCQQFVTHRNNKGCKRIHSQKSSSNMIFSRSIFLSFVVFIQLF
ncbi:unnamed protein product [Rotaria magnacalcarata]|uniref:Ig-like domain-containing protein n=4 Tax=Rotaria magnacalcarata TaxID=392030 RepID=A0A819NYT5_9BILA|nr:unnamed protein product [Rotaria magnacalcarata]CAF1914059.1 unnamed protein product [Rotaria magnacalcarata]CAF1976980.1 unnamed protein product [Rotaria magnacalcarata]CAF3794427.1 unnamed protein product [Rotaria magnacalcarata]CAF4004519.1 unnamed protein product [Rotaria magnacalcarata]